MAKQTKAYRKALKANCEYIDRKRLEALIAAGKSPRVRRRKRRQHQRRRASHVARKCYFDGADDPITAEYLEIVK